MRALGRHIQIPCRGAAGRYILKIVKFTAVKERPPFPPVKPKRAPEPQPPPSWWELGRKRIVRLYGRFDRPILVALGVAAALVAVLLYGLIKPEPQTLTPHDVDAAVQRALEAAPPEPSYASTAYQVIRPSTVLIRVPGAEGAEDSGGALGSGVVIAESGLILTCLHVVGEAAMAKVWFADGSESDAVVIAREPENDLAVLRALVIPDDLVPATMASSAMLQVGDQVAVVGHPFGIGNSLSAGVVSGLGRTYRSPDTGQALTNLIQFDAAVNPGNSGGPLVNRDGEVVGIVTALLNPTEQNVFIGIGFAVPIETAAAAAGEPVW
jgi:S1-C subfamily serine protease